MQRGERRPVGLLLLRQLVAEPAHRPVEVMELEVVAPLDLVVLPPLVGGAVAAGGEEPVQDGEEDGPLERELEPPSLEELPEDRPTAGGLPEPLEDQGRTDVADGDGGEAAVGVLGDQQDRLGQPGAGGEQGVELAALLELVEPPECSDDALAGAAALPAVLDHLEVGAWAGGLGAEEHGALRCGTP